MTAFCMYIAEKNNQSIFKEDCIWLMAQANMTENKRHLLKQPYLRQSEAKQQRTKQTQYKTIDETLNYIFDAI